MSLIASNLANGKTISTDQVSGNITQYLSKLGFTDIRNISNNGEIYVGKKTITYYGVTKNIYSIVVGERNLENNYYAMLMKNKETNGVVNATYVDYGKTIEELAKSLCPQIFNDNNFSANTYWITGYGLAGSIASEIAARFSDGGGEVFCYTFGAINTGKGRKGTYLNIKNVINEDDYIPKMMNREIFTKPGQIYSSSIKEDLLREYRDIIGNTNYKGDYYLSNFISKIFEERKNGISNEMYEKLAREWSRHLEHYSNMSSELQTNGETSDMAIAINNMSRATEDAHSMKSYYVLAKSLNGFDLTDGNGEKIIRYQYIPGAMLVSFNQTETVTEEIDTSFADALRMKIVSIRNINYEHQGKDKRKNDKYDWCYKLTGKNEFMYTNYTLPSNINSYDISYSQFWDDEDTKIKIAGSGSVALNVNSSHYLLYKNNAGDFSADTTRMTFGRYHAMSDGTSEKVQKFKPNYILLNGPQNNYQFKLTILDGRILTAAPLHLLSSLISGEKDDNCINEGYINDLYINNMDILENYRHKVGEDENKKPIYAYDGIGELRNDGSISKINSTASDNRQFKYIDVVVESQNGYQYVVPFIAIDTKWLHNNTGNHYSTLTDNTYGHVYETVSDGSINIDSHYYSHMNPLEPYIEVLLNGNKCNDKLLFDLSSINNEIQEMLFGTDKIVSMRLYDKKFSESNPSWWVDIKDNMRTTEIVSYKDNIDDGIITDVGGGIIVDYKTKGDK